MTMSSQSVCECLDHGCPAHRGKPCHRLAHTADARGSLLFRVDMEDRTGTLFCAACAEDAAMSGLYSDDRG